MKIAIDIMGTDHGPKELVLGAVNAVKKYDCEVVLVGDEEVAKEWLGKYNALDNQMNYEYARHEKREKRSKKEIGIHSIRGGNEVGKHSVIFFSNNESFEITHNVNSRAVFANGAIKAATFLFHQEPGFYDMNDLCR